MWDNIIDHLNDPLLVVNVQNFFGVKYKKNCQTNETSIIQSDRHDREDEFNIKEHKRIPSDSSGSSQYSTCSSTDTSSEDKEEMECHINNKFWYYLFLLGTALGDEIFYATFIPFWFWNIDGAVGRRVVMVWTIVMYIGQGFKDIIRWPRPGYPVKKLQQKWAIEYGMPSTHAMVGVSIPFSVLLFTMDRYQYPVHWGVLIAVSWCTLICVSRVYLGMHSVLDIAAGLSLAALLLLPLVPLAGRLDAWLLGSPAAPLAVLAVSVLAIVYCPHSDTWTPTRNDIPEVHTYPRGDTTMIVSVCAGLQLGAWTNYRLGNMAASSQPPPYDIIWPSMEMLGCTLLRTTLGFCGVLATRALAKSFSYALVCALLGQDQNRLRHSEHGPNNTSKVFVECSYKYLTYGLIGFNTTYLFPNVFEMLMINRPTYYTEI